MARRPAWPRPIEPPPAPEERTFTLFDKLPIETQCYIFSLTFERQLVDAPAPTQDFSSPPRCWNPKKFPIVNEVNHKARDLVLRAYTKLRFPYRETESLLTASPTAKDLAEGVGIPFPFNPVMDILRLNEWQAPFPYNPQSVYEPVELFKDQYWHRLRHVTIDAGLLGSWLSSDPISAKHFVHNFIESLMLFSSMQTVDLTRNPAKSVRDITEGDMSRQALFQDISAANNGTPNGGWAWRGVYDPVHLRIVCEDKNLKLKYDDEDGADETFRSLGALRVRPRPGTAGMTHPRSAQDKKLALREISSHLYEDSSTPITHTDGVEDPPGPPDPCSWRYWAVFDVLPALPGFDWHRSGLLQSRVEYLRDRLPEIWYELPPGETHDDSVKEASEPGMIRAVRHYVWGEHGFFDLYGLVHFWVRPFEPGEAMAPCHGVCLPTYGFYKYSGTR